MPSFAYLFERFPSFVQTFVYREAEEMVRQKMEPWLVSIRRPDDAAELAESIEGSVFYLPEADAIRAEIDQLRAQRKLPWRVHRAIPKHRQQPDANRLFEAAWLGPRLREQRITHVHAHFGGVAARTAWWLKKLHGFTYSFTGHANDIFCESGMPVTNETLVRDARFVVTETEFARRWVQEKYPRHASKIFRVYNGLDDNFPARAPRGGAPLILSVGRLVEKKGFGDLIEACKGLRERGAAFSCEIVGEGPLQPALQEQIDTCGLGEIVRLLGPRSQGEVRKLLSESQLFVLACVPEQGGGSDNLPTVVMEAMMCGLPVVSTKLAGVPEMITSGENGVLVEPRNPRALSAAMEQLLTNPEQASELAESARKTALDKFHLATTTRSLKHLLVREGCAVPPKAACDDDPELLRVKPQRWFF